MFEQTAEKIKNAKIIPVAKVQEKEDAIKLARALTNGGMKAVEITFRTNDGETFQQERKAGVIKRKTAAFYIPTSRKIVRHD